MEEWVFKRSAFLKTQEIIDLNVPNISNVVLPIPLHHYTSLEVMEKIFSNDDVRLCHAEYSNDQNEIEEAKRVIGVCLAGHTGNRTFLDDVKAIYQTHASKLDAYIFCMSAGPQDLLSQWRAYGQDGRGACISFDQAGFGRLTAPTKGLRISEVIYDLAQQQTLINAVLTSGDGLYSSIGTRSTAITITVAALVYITPLIKAAGFSEEREWRLVFTPAPEFAIKHYFFPRRDFLAPYLKFSEVLSALHISPAGAPCLPTNGVMIGPSGHQKLNERSVAKLLAQKSVGFGSTPSTIPYRSMS